MKLWSALAVAASSCALLSCGSSGAMAPVVYGTQPESTGRIYNSPTDVMAQPPARTAAVPVRQTYASSGPVQLAPLTPVASEQLPPAAVYGASYETAPTAPVQLDPAIVTTSDSPSALVSVQPGDTVYAISRRTGVAPQTIIAENNLVAPYALAVGQTLRIPSPQQKIANFNAPQSPQITPIHAVAAVDRMHVVASGDTLYSISRASGVGVSVIAQANNLRPPYTLRTGDRILVRGARGTIAQPIQREAKATPLPDSGEVAELAKTVSYTPPPVGQQKAFDWPVKGAVIGKFGMGSLGRRNDGINIAAPVGTPVRAAADGEVVYRGSELDGYGNLILVKHPNNYVTAYAHNDVMLVKKGDHVEKGQVIAKVGQTGAATEPQLHFEIRQNLKAVDPLAVLDK
jgi:murein DD-endopeptidase MepM/ murein hydrolase activator NlpD